MNASIVIAAVATGLLLSVSPETKATNADVEVTSMQVQFADLDVNTAHGAHQLYARINRAAAETCGDDGERVDIAEMRVINDCRQKAIEHAVAGMARPRLTALYDKDYPKQALPAPAGVVAAR